MSKNLELLEGEEIISTLRPVPISFLSQYMVTLLPLLWSLLYVGWLFEALMGEINSAAEVASGPLWSSPEGMGLLALASLSSLGGGTLLGVIKRKQRKRGAFSSFLKGAFFSALWVAGSTQGLYLFLWIFGLLLFGSLSAAAIAKVDMHPLAVFTLIGLIGMGYILGFGGEDIADIPVLLIISGSGTLLFFLLFDIYRRSHKYIITNRRLILRKGLFSFDERRVMFKNITDLDLHIGIMGRLLNYGDIIPVTASGFGLGTNRVAFTFNAGKMLRVGGEASAEVTTGRAQTFDMLYGIPAPRTVVQVLSKLVFENSAEYHLEKLRKNGAASPSL